MLFGLSVVAYVLVEGYDINSVVSEVPRHLKLNNVTLHTGNSNLCTNVKLLSIDRDILSNAWKVSGSGRLSCTSYASG
jgi:hypothetical protein